MISLNTFTHHFLTLVRKKFNTSLTSMIPKTTWLRWNWKCGLSLYQMSKTLYETIELQNDQISEKTGYKYKYQSG